MADSKDPSTLIDDRAGRSSRRRFLRGVGATAGLFAAPSLLRGIRADGAYESSELFSLGVASGDPGSRSVVLWTRLAPEPLTGGGMPNRSVRVRWEVATDRGMSRVVRRGSVIARARKGHAVHAVVHGLAPDLHYYYRFYAMGESSRVGRTRTFPAAGLGRPSYPRTGHMRFAVVSCQNYNQGFYPAYRDMLDQDLDFVVHTGDYIYEGGATSQPIAPGRSHDDVEVASVEEYRNRYALYRLDEDLQNAHAEMPFLCTWDDHEVDNNYAGLVAEETAPLQGDEFRERRNNAYRVYAESMPLRLRNRIQFGGRLRLNRRLRFGDLADIHVLDTRQMRSDQAAGDNFGSTDPASPPATSVVEAAFGESIFDPDGILDPDATLLGDRQEAWLARNLYRSRARWNVLAQQVMVTEWNLVETGRQSIELDPQIPADQKSAILAALSGVSNILNVDAWDGYPAARRRLFDLLLDARPSNPVVLTGDIHSSWAANLLDDFQDSQSQMVAAEFVCTSIASTFLASDPRPTDFIVRAGIVADNPHIEFFNGLFRGYCLCDVDDQRWQTTYRGVGSLADLGNPSPDALVPKKDSVVETDAVVSVRSGFSEPGSDERLVTDFARVPLRP